MAAFADAHRPAGGAPQEPAYETDASLVAASIDRTMPLRPAGRTGYRWRPLLIDARLLWRTWFIDAHGPHIVFAPRSLPTTALDMMYGLHVGAHLDHLAALLRDGRPATAYRLQFGRGLLAAEAAAMLVELLVLAGMPQQQSPAVRRFLYDSVVDRLARLPGISEWGPSAAPHSPTMAAAAAHPNREFATLPTLATAYVAGPFRLISTGLAHPFIPHSLRVALRASMNGRRGTPNSKPRSLVTTPSVLHIGTAQAALDRWRTGQGRGDVANPLHQREWSQAGGGPAFQPAGREGGPGQKHR
jgi:hypothetical protein